MNPLWNDWLNRTQTIEDNIDLIFTSRMAATLGVAAPKKGENLPLLWHWMFFQPALNAHELGKDGHPALGGFLPPAKGRNRMWAGGQFDFRQPLVIGSAAQCISTIEKIEEKQGKTGSLLFVTVRHEYTQNGLLAMIERQNIVYREPTAPKKESAPLPEGEWQQEFSPNSTQLFRYSAVTFNGHRIHYDYPYATAEEGYDNLVIHGPMMATWLLMAFQAAQPHKTIRQFSYRGLRPATLPASLLAGGAICGEHEADVWIGNQQGIVQQGKVVFD